MNDIEFDEELNLKLYNKLLLYNENHAIVAWFNKGYCR